MWSPTTVLAERDDTYLLSARWVQELVSVLWSYVMEHALGMVSFTQNGTIDIKKVKHFVVSLSTNCSRHRTKSKKLPALSMVVAPSTGVRTGFF